MKDTRNGEREWGYLFLSFLTFKWLQQKAQRRATPSQTQHRQQLQHPCLLPRGSASSKEPVRVRVQTAALVRATAKTTTLRDRANRRVIKRPVPTLKCGILTQRFRFLAPLDLMPGVGDHYLHMNHIFKIACSCWNFQVSFKSLHISDTTIEYLVFADLCLLLVLYFHSRYLFLCASGLFPSLNLKLWAAHYFSGFHPGQRLKAWPSKEGPLSLPTRHRPLTWSFKELSFFTKIIPVS